MSATYKLNYINDIWVLNVYRDNFYNVKLRFNQDDLTVTELKNGLNSFQFDKIPLVEKCNDIHITKYYYDANMNKLTNDEYQTKLEHLLSKSYTDDDGDMQFEDLNDEYNYKKFIRDWKPEIIKHEHWEKITPVVLKYEDIGNEHFIPAYTFPNLKPNSKELIYIYKRFEYCRELIINFCDKYNLEYENDNLIKRKEEYNHFNYTKINNRKIVDMVDIPSEYLFSDDSKHVLIDGYEKLKNLRSQDEQHINEMMKYILNFLKPTELSMIDATEIYISLKKCKDSLRRIEPKQKDGDRLRTSICILNDIVSKLESIIQNKN